MDESVYRANSHVISSTQLELSPFVMPDFRKGDAAIVVVVVLSFYLVVFPLS